MSWSGYGWAAKLVDVDPTSHQMLIRPGSNPELSASLQAQTPKEMAARDAALKLSGIAIEYFADVSDGARVLNAAQDKLRFKAAVKETLAYQEHALLTAKYIEKLQDPKVVGPSTDGPLYSPDTVRLISVPSATFDLTNDGKIREICFGRPPYAFKGGLSPYTAVCADRDTE